MSEFKVTLSRIEAVEESELGKEVCVVFNIERDRIAFQIPIYLRSRDFDDTEMVQAARSSLHRIFVELADLSKAWELSPGEIDRLSKMNLRPPE